MLTPHVVIIGSGFAGLEFIKGINKKTVQVTVIDKNNYFNFQPLMYQVASGELGPDAITYPLRKLIGRMPNVVFRMAEVMKINITDKILITNIGEITFDYLILATGAQTNFFGNKIIEQYAMQLKSIPDALDLRSDILQEFEEAINLNNQLDKANKHLNFVVVGGGPTGVETAGALAEIKKNALPKDYKELDPSMMQVYLIEASHGILASMSEISSKKAKEFLEKLGVKVLVKTSVINYQPESGELTLSSGEKLYTNTVIWSAGVKGKTIDGIPESLITKNNRYICDEYNRLKGFENIFVIGDLAFIDADPAYPNGHPMVATVAQQQGRLLAKNLLHIIQHKPLKPYKFLNLGSMATIGRHKAVLEIFGMKTQGYLAWLVWMFVHLILILGLRNRFIVFFNWLWNYINYQGAIRIIIRPFKPNSTT
ncbi:MAG: NAD(P)/FAD-dependent oxidoreductase [Bacteroidia bacterium]|jgi:NADH dehydrogenase|nr:NAD(P)/FAD-dependent oxidoreductase [Bacteroidia bacterium]